MYILYIHVLCTMLLLLLLSRFSHVQLCDPVESSPPGSSVPGILQARILEIMYYTQIINILLIFYCSIKFQILEFYKRMMAFSEC